MTEFERQPDTWPLQRGDMLSNHDWFPFYIHRFLTSNFLLGAVMEDRRGDVGTALILWCESMRQDPAGTLPDSDMELASLAKYGTVADWLAVRAGVMHGWVKVRVEDAETGDCEIRLGHPRFMQGVVEQMHKRKLSRDGAREASKLAVRKSRIRKKMAELKVRKHVIEDDRVMAALAEYFAQSDIYITADNVRAAMTEVIGYTGEVTHITSRRSG